MAFSQRDQAWIETATLLAAWAAVIAIVNPRGNFPMVDDWDFALATWSFARTGVFHFTEFTAVSLRAQVLWGAAWTRLFGESFEVLRASTLMLSALAVAIVHRTLVRVEVPRFARIVATLALIVHPIFLWASCTFMTDVPFVFTQAVAFYCFVRALREERLAFAIGGTAAVVVSWFIRQNGVFAIAAVIAVLLIGRERITKRWLAIAITASSGVAFFALIFLTHREWLSGTPAMFAIHYQMWGESSFRLPEQLALMGHYAGFNAINSALFFLPLTLPLLAIVRPLRRPIVLAIVATLLLFRTIELARSGYLVPYESRELFSDVLPGALVFDCGIGSPLLFDTYNLGYTYPFTMPHAMRIVLTALVALIAIALVWMLARVKAEHAAHRLALGWIVFGTCVLFASGYYYDRYSFDSAWAIVIALPFVLSWERRTVRVLSIVGLVLLATFTIFGVQENFRWSRVRWQAFNELRARGVSVQEIDGGAEAFAFYELRNATRKSARQPHSARQYAIAFTPLDGYRVIATYPFESFGGLRKGAIYALDKQP